MAGAGTLAELLANPNSITGQSLREVRHFPARGERRKVDRKTPKLTLHHAKENNLKNLTVEFPLNRFVVVTGVSGSGKSTMIRECLIPAVKNCLARAKDRVRGEFCKVTGFESLKAVYEVDQSPVGRTPRSIPATYVGFFDVIRTGSAFARVFAEPFFIQQRAGPMSGMRRRRPGETRNEFPSARVYHL